MKRSIFLKTLSILTLVTATQVTHAGMGMMGFPTLDDYQERSFQWGVKLTIPDFPKTLEEITAIEQQVLAEYQAMGDIIASLAQDELTFENSFRAIDWGVSSIYSKVLPINVVKNTHADPALREAASEALKRITTAQIEFSYREDVYKSLRKFSESGASLNAEDQRLVDHMLLEYQRLGFDLPLDERARVETLNKEISDLEIQFGDNIREANETLVFTAEDLEGVSASFLQSIRNVEGEYEIQTNVTHHATTVFKSAKSEAVRQQLFTARSNRAKASNVVVLEQLVRKRTELAHALGYNTWADYQTETRMAGNGKTARNFVGELVFNLRPKLREELNQLAQIKREVTKDPIAKVNIWDVSYLQEIQRQRLYDLDSEALRQYFPYEKCVDGMFQIYETVFNIQIEEIENPTLWDPMVSLYAVSDVESERPLGLFYIDPFPREGKFNHFAQFPIIVPGELPDGSYQRATVALVCNFPPPTENGPSLLSFDQVETLFHEFGHCMHSILTEAKHSTFAGTSVPRDFVEAPSQVMEYWLQQQDVVDLFAANWMDQSKRMPEGTLERINASKKAQAGWFYSRQLTFGMIDMTLHHQENIEKIAADVVAATNAIAKRILLPFPDDTAFVAAFGHLAGYDAGYYGYAWADVLAADLASEFEKSEEGFMDPELGMKLRKEIFEPGNSRDVNESVLRFLGREPNNEAFIESLGISVSDS